MFVYNFKKSVCCFILCSYIFFTVRINVSFYYRYERLSAEQPTNQLVNIV